MSLVAILGAGEIGGSTARGKISEVLEAESCVGTYLGIT